MKFKLMAIAFMFNSTLVFGQLRVSVKLRGTEDQFITYKVVFVRNDGSKFTLKYDEANNFFRTQNCCTNKNISQFRIISEQEGVNASAPINCSDGGTHNIELNTDHGVFSILSNEDFNISKNALGFDPIQIDSVEQIVTYKRDLRLEPYFEQFLQWTELTSIKDERFFLQGATNIKTFAEYRNVTPGVQQFYVWYSPKFLDSLFTNDFTDQQRRVIIYGILFHEFAHKHLEHHKEKSSLIKLEEDADNFAGRMLRTYNICKDTTEAAWMIDKVVLQEGGNNYYPSRTKRIQAVKRGWIEKDNEYRSPLNRAYEFYDKKQYDSCLVILDSISGHLANLDNENKLKFHELYGDCYFAKGRNFYEDATTKYNEYIRLRRDNYLVYFKIGVAKFEEGSFTRAKEFFKKCIDLKAMQSTLKSLPLSSQAFYYIGRMEFQNNRIDDAIQAFDGAIKLDSTNSFAYEYRARAKEKKNTTNNNSFTNESIKTDIKLSLQTINISNDSEARRKELEEFLLKYENKK